jgi:penicillin-binding protein 1A
LKKAIQIGFWVSFTLLLVSAATVGYVFFTVIPRLPSIEAIRQMELTIPLRVYTIDGHLIAEFGDQRRNPVPIEETPDLLIKAVLSAEDDRFFQHHGVDFGGVIRALIANLQSGDIVQGFSTVTMQVAGNYFLDRREKTYTRKLKEVLLAFKLERKLSKQEILELYVNKIFLGQRAYGFAAAASVYFNKTLADLNLSEIATLAGVPKAPSAINPITNPDGARSRRDYVLKRMMDLHHISNNDYLAARNTPVTATQHITPIEIEATYIAEMVRSYMVENYGKTAYEKGYRVYTTINSNYQTAANRALRRGLIDYDQRHGFRGPVGFLDPDAGGDLSPVDSLQQYASIGGLRPAVVSEVSSESIDVLLPSGKITQIDPVGWKWTASRISSELRTGDVVYVSMKTGATLLAQVPEIQGAIVSLDPTDGALLALTGGFDFYSGKFNRATQARRQPGSNIKPFIYSAALDNGFTAATLVSGAPIVVEDNLGDTWRPENYSKKVFGPTRLRRALVQSLNLVSVRLVRGLGTPLVREHLQQFGFNQEYLPQGLSLALGSASFTPLEMARAYGVFANGGYLVEPYFIARVEDQRGEIMEYANRSMLCPECTPPAQHFTDPDLGVLYDPRYSKRVLSPENAFLMTELMRSVIRTGTGRRALSLGREDLAGKTGTTNNFRDAWFSGFNRDVVTSVWVGFDKPKDLGARESGARAALPIWIDYMEVALQGKPEKPLRIPENIITAWVHKDTGEAIAVDDPRGLEEYFVMGTEPHAQVRGGAPAIQIDVSESSTTIEELF